MTCNEALKLARRVMQHEDLMIGKYLPNRNDLGKRCPSPAS